MPRNIVTSTLKRFRGLNQFRTLTALSPEWSLDCVNVIVSGSWGLEKFRYPLPLSSAQPGMGTGPDNFAYYTKSGVRQVIACYGTALWKYEIGGAYPATKIDTNALNARAIFAFVESNNLLFMANGQRMLKWNGTAVQNWGIAGPTQAPTVGLIPPPGATPVNIAAVSGTVNLLNPGSGATQATDTIAVFQTDTPHNAHVGDTIIIDGVTDPSFNGTFTVQAVDSAAVLEVYHPGIAGLVSFAGTLQVGTGGASGVVRQSNEVTVTTTAAHGRKVGDLITIAGVTDASFNGNFQIDSIIDALTFTYPQVGATAFSGSGTETPRSGNVYSLGGRQYRISYMNSVTGHCSNASLASAATGNLIGALQVIVAGIASPDAQVDTAVLWATQDGGGDFYYDQQIALAPGATPVFTDTILDGQLNFAIGAPFLNNPPLTGKYLQKWQGRVFIFNLTSDPQGIAYSGYERILFGRPEESFPPSNRLRLAIGADDIRGGGVIQAGIVAFSESGSMFMLKGSIEDITTTSPVQFTAFLEELPWQLGCLSGYAVESTPRGLVWWAGDKTVQLFSGYEAPVSISDSVAPFLKRATQGQEQNARSAFFNFLDREWYVLLFAIDGSQQLNKGLIFDMHPDPDQNAGVFPFDVGNVNAIGVIADGSGQRILTIAKDGLLQEVLAASDTTNGVSLVKTSTTNLLGGYYRTGYFGAEDGERYKLVRYARLISDQTGFRVKAYSIDDDNFTVANPEITEFGLVQLPKFAINKKTRRLSYEIRFPDQDVSANVLEFASSAIPLSNR